MRPSSISRFRTHGGVAGSLLLLVLASCASPVTVLGEGETTGVIEGTTGGSVGPATQSASASSSDGTGSETSDTSPMCGQGELGCPTNKIDLLFVIDNSGTMGEEQLNLAVNFPALIDELQTLQDTSGQPVQADVNIMVTTTDFGNPACDPFEPADYESARGAPISTPCTERLQRFTGLGPSPLVVEEACLDVCDPGAPARPLDQFIHFTPEQHNVQGGSPADALACIGPQGIDGCGFEAPLETMAQALRPDACWNDPGPGCEDTPYVEPFLRPDAVLAIAIITDEADCSVNDYGIMTDPTFMETPPNGGQPEATSALCWNAGVVCTGLDPGTGIYSGCIAANHGPDGAVGVDGSEAVLHPLSRYTDLLQSFRSAGKEVIMLGILGVPVVTEHAQTPPFQPTAGGVEALVYRRWTDPAYPDGDILPDEYAADVRAVDKQYEFGIGPGCTGYVEESDTYTGQAIPPVRIREVCESLNQPDDPDTPQDESRIRCCIESICGEDFTPALRCLTGLIRDVIVPVG